jgi:hypothetical protein
MIRGLLVFLCILTAIHVGYIFASPVIKNKMLEGKMKEVAKESALKPAELIRKDLMEFINEKEIPLTSSEIVIQQDGRKLTLAAHYTTHAEFWFYERDYEFFPASHPSARLSPARHRTRKAVHAGN